MCLCTARPNAATPPHHTRCARTAGCYWARCRTAEPRDMLCGAPACPPAALALPPAIGHAGELPNPAICCAAHLYTHSLRPHCRLHTTPAPPAPTPAIGHAAELLNPAICCAAHPLRARCRCWGMAAGVDDWDGMGHWCDRQQVCLGSWRGTTHSDLQLRPNLFAQLALGTAPHAHIWPMLARPAVAAHDSWRPECHPIWFGQREQQSCHRLCLAWPTILID